MQTLLPNPAIAPILFKETLSYRTLKREPEPPVMDGCDQVAAFIEAGAVDGMMAATYVLNTALITQVIQGCRFVIDLGCGPGAQLAEVAALNPETSFLGIDLSREALARARKRASSSGLSNLDFACLDITCLEGIADGSVDGVISTLALHHLPAETHLRQCFQEIARVLRPGGAVYLIDLLRPRSARTVRSLAYIDQQRQPQFFIDDYERSLRAAFLLDDFRSLTDEILRPPISVVGSFPTPLLALVKTKARPLSVAHRKRLRELRRSLSRYSRSNLDVLRMILRLGGLRSDPLSK